MEVFRIHFEGLGFLLANFHGLTLEVLCLSYARLDEEAILLVGMLYGKK